jgi:2-polyprenyl-3-methyl-5-hydroxy-6-metoxy-1,4-benzoquinol methylase
MAGHFEDVPIDEVQRYWNERPCNIRHSPRPVGEREYFEEVEARKYFVEPHIPDFADFERWKGLRVLEIGCGIGTDTIGFARAGASVTAVDLSDRSLEVASQRAEVFGLEDRIRFLQADVEQLSDFLPAEKFDLIYSFGVLHHTPHPDRALRVLRQYLQPGGSLKIMMYHRLSWKVFWILMGYGRGQFWKLDELIARWSEAQTGCPVTYSYSRRELAALLEETGYAVDDMFVDHIFPWKISEYVNYRYQKVWYFRILPDALFRALERRLGWHLCATARPV